MVSRSRAEHSAATDRSTAAPGLSAGGESLRRSISQLPFLKLGFWQFVMVLGGIVAGVAGTWNLPRQESLRGLQEQLEHLEQTRETLVRETAEERRWYEGVALDRRVETHVLESALGPEPDRGIPLRLWLTGTRPEPTP